MANQDNRQVRYKMYKSGKLWLVTGITAAAFVGIDLSNQAVVHADVNQSVATSAASSSSIVADSVSVSSATSASSVSAAVVSSATKGSIVDSAASTASYNATKLNAAEGPVLKNESAVSSDTSTSEALMTNTILDQNFHYNVPRGYSNDVQTILPHSDANGKIDYYDVYYLYNAYPSQMQFADEWYHATTTDFKTFQPFDSANPTGLNNVAIPDPDYVDSNGNTGLEVASNNKNGIPWNYVATGSVIYNDGLLKTDQWNHPIDFNAKLAYFTSFTSDGDQMTFLAYSNNDQQFHPYQDQPVMKRQQFGIDLQDFRDPSVVRTQNGFVAYVSGGWSKQMYVLTSTDGVHWHYNSANNINLDQGQAMEVETPIVKTISGQPYLFYSWSTGDNANEKGINAISGEIDSQGIFKLNSSSQITNLDGSAYKGDTYAGNFVNIDPDTLININWSGSWQYSLVGNTLTYTYSKHSGSFLLPRVMQNLNGVLWSTPIEPNNQLVGTIKTTQADLKHQFIIGTNNKLDFTFDHPAQTHSIKLSRGESKVTITIKNGKLTLSRKNVINQQLAKKVTIQLPNLNTTKMTLYLDNTTLELYLPEQNLLYNVINFTSNQNDPYLLATNSSATIDNYQFNNKYPGLTPAAINTVIAKLGTAMKTSQTAVRQLTQSLNRYYQTNIKGDDYATASAAAQTATQQLSAAQSAVSLASGYASQAVALSGDARENVYLTLASSAYAKASTDATSASQAVLNANQLMTAVAPSTFKSVAAVAKRSGKVVTDQKGNPHYYDSITGVEMRNTFYMQDGKYYYFDKNGNMVKNRFFKAVPNTDYYYYFNQKGQALTGKQIINHKEYLFDSSGIQVRNQFVKGKAGKFRYYNRSGVLVTKSGIINGHALTIKANGQITSKNKLIQFNDYITKQPKTYYLNGKSEAYHGVKQVGRVIYNFSKQGNAVYGTFVVNSKNKVTRYYDKYGNLIKYQYVLAFGKQDSYYFFDANGKAVSGGYTVNGIEQYFHPNGILAMNQFLFYQDGRIRYADEHGNIYKNYLFTAGGKQYYAGVDGYLLQNQTQVINGVTYKANKKGVLTPVNKA
ncbi:KxYKxGKxW signal peptide domain-containing protein [Lactobacillus sp. Sy-1]|uniref:KxYKxGKxW signal peptide domain-containing protein n=1 Tax=Lactobacillus sp. Sy-1 TaxID=2109645 RepID=UPI001C59C5EF|nr:KxYKxGKxW signal peptide domain-containing protein [Lactobacillus sp. Sy-1]MBW1605173.1 KxYKxGKxW signal peptide domain-containing protein [Lactobacillus sp. Sy-1]